MTSSEPTLGPQTHWTLRFWTSGPLSPWAPASPRLTDRRDVPSLPPAGADGTSLPLIALRRERTFHYAPDVTQLCARREYQALKKSIFSL